MAVFRVPLVLCRRGWGWLLGDTFLLLVHAGRKTGKPYSTVAMVLSYDPHTHEAVICSAWGQDVDWIRNIRARPAVHVQIGRESFAPQQRFLSEDESLAVGWGDLGSDAAARDFVSTRPFVSLAPARLRPPTLGAVRDMTDPAQDGPPAPDTPLPGPSNQGTGSQPGQRPAGAGGDGLLAVVKNLSHYLAQSTASKHLACLRECGLIQVRPVGRASVYSLAQPALAELLGAAETVLAATGNAVALCPAYGPGR